MLIRTAKVNTEIFNARSPEIVPVLSHGYGSYEGRRFGILKMHAAVARIYKSYLTNQGDIAMEAEKVPMLVPPRPWSSVNEGGYLVHPGKLSSACISVLSLSCSFYQCNDEYFKINDHLI